MDDRALLRYNLVFVWLATAATSVSELDGQSRQLMADAGVPDRSLARAAVWSGALLDAAVGLALWMKPARLTFLMALGTMLALTFLATLLIPALWLHPLGPLSKNVAIGAVSWVLIRTSP